MKSRVIVIVGAGHHARRIYIPELMGKESFKDIKIVIIDLFEVSPIINDYIVQQGYEDRAIIEYINRDAIEFEKSKAAKRILETYDILGVIISTDPLNHMQYASWALKNNLHVLMDKPISTYENVVQSLDAAHKIHTDYEVLMNLYERSSSMFCLSTQRRYETGYKFVNELVAEVTARFGMPITSIQAFHSDGLWIFPDELIHQRMHPFNSGYGKLSHSGFHILDAVWQFYQEGSVSTKAPDTFETFASATYPAGLLKNFGTDEYRRIFRDFTRDRDDESYIESTKGFGEVDVFANMVLKKDDVAVAVFTINLLHNGFSRRSWQFPAKDLYKGNGRVKHQSFIIEQGPFQCIQIHNYQSTDKHDGVDDEGVYDLGGKNHFDINVFRNAKLFSLQEPCVKQYSSSQIDKLYSENATKLSNEIAKSILIEEFLVNCQKIKQGMTRDEVSMSNSLTTYGMQVKMMSNIYKSLVLRSQGKNSVVVDDV